MTVGASPPPLGSPATRPAILRALAGRIRSLRAAPLLSPVAMGERWVEWNGRHPVSPDHGPHLAAAVDWLARAQEATPDDGFSRGYGLTWDSYFGARGWQPSYPETTGYIIPTLYQAARHLNRADLAERATRAARWELAIQLPSGAVRGGVIGQESSPAVFNTGQVMFGWLAALHETGSSLFADAARRAATFLVESLDHDGLWRRGNSRFAASGSTLYNTRTAWALAEAGTRLEAREFTSAAARNLTAVARRCLANGWVPDCCLDDAAHPLLHTIAYALRGLLEGGRVLEDTRLIDRAAVAAEHIATTVRSDGSLPGRYTASWSPAAEWSCLTGNAQMANVWLRLTEITGDRSWLEPVAAVVPFVKSTQNRTSHDSGLRGGIKGSFPMHGGYGRYQVLSWAVKFFVDALIRDERVRTGAPTKGDEPIVLS